MYAQESIDLLQGSGIQFKQHEDEGVEPLYFAELLMTSGIVLMDEVKWVTFHRFGYFDNTAAIVHPSGCPKGLPQRMMIHTVI